MAIKKKVKQAAVSKFPTKASSPANYALMAMDTMLSLSGTQPRDEGSKRIYSEAGVDVAMLELVGSELIVEFQAPARLDVAIEGARTLKEFLGCYEPVTGKPGWLRFRRPATRDPKPGLEARLGPMLGQAARQRQGSE